MRRSLVLVPILAGLLACKLRPEARFGPAEAEAEAEAAPISLRFGWTPGRVEVDETIRKQGHDISTRYVLEVREHDGGLAVEYRDFRFTAFDRLDLDDPEVGPQVDAVERQFALLQLGFRVADDGVFVGLLDVEQLERGFEQFYGPEAAAELRAMLANPRWNQVITEAVAKPWRSWVEVWIGLEARAGEIIEDELEAEFGGAMLVHHVRYEHRGPDPERPGHVLLRHVDDCDDPRFMLALGEMAAELTDELDAAALDRLAEATAEAGGSGFSYRRTVDVSLDPGKMVPAWAKDVVRAEFEAREQVETHEWTFVAVSSSG